jgi:hypothetical protein
MATALGRWTCFLAEHLGDSIQSDPYSISACAAQQGDEATKIQNSEDLHLAFVDPPTWVEDSPADVVVNNAAAVDGATFGTRASSLCPCCLSKTWKKISQMFDEGVSEGEQA